VKLRPYERGGAVKVGAGLIASATMIAAITVVSRVFGFGRWLVFANNVGSKCVGEAYTSANVLPNVLFEVAAGGALAGAVVPLLAGPLSRAAGGRADVDRIASALIGWTLLVLVPASVLLALLSGPLSRLLTDEKCSGEQALTARLLLVFAPQIVLYGVGVVLAGILTAQRRFFWPAAAPLLSSLVVIGAYLAFGASADGAQGQPNRLPGAAEAWLAWGTTGGVAMMTVPLLLPVYRSGVRLRPTLRFPSGVGRRGAVLAAAGVSALLAQQAALLVAVLLAGDSTETGSFAVFQYAQAVYLLPYAVLAVPLATSAFPRLAEQASTGDRAGFAAIASISTRAVSVVALLGAAVLVAVAEPVAGFFDVIAKGDVGDLGPALTVLAPGLLGFAFIAHIGRALYALEQGRSAAASIAAGWLVVIAGSLAAVAVTGVVTGLAWGNTIGMTVGGGLLVFALARVAGPESVAGLPRVLLAGVIAAGVAGVVGREVGVRVLAAMADGITGSLVAGTLAAMVSAIGFVLLLSLLDRQDLAAVLDRVPGLERVAGRSGAAR
jgi:putative peptidoglycan lipid II flippase